MIASNTQVFYLGMSLEKKTSAHPWPPVLVFHGLCPLEYLLLSSALAPFL